VLLRLSVNSSVSFLCVFAIIESAELLFWYYFLLKLRGSCLCWYVRVGFGSLLTFLAGNRKGEGVQI